MSRGPSKKNGDRATPRSPKKKPQPKPDAIPPGLRQMIEKSRDLARQALSAYSPLVEDVIQNASRDKKQIERLLDGILGFCYDEKMLALYKKLCRHYYYIDPGATAEYVYAYRDMWDEKAGETGK